MQSLRESRRLDEVDGSVLIDMFSDEVLISAIADGEIWALELLYQRYRHHLHSLIYPIVTDYQVTQTILQDVFLAVWRSAATYSPQAGKVRGWLLTIMRNRTIDYLRTHHRRSKLQEVRLEMVEEDDHPTLPDAWDEAWRSLLCTQVRLALVTLVPEQRLVIALAYFQGWTHAQIAQEYHIPLGTVKARIRLGLRHLKQALEYAGIDEW